MDYATRTGLFFRKVKAEWLVTVETGGGETVYLCLVPSAKLYLPMLPWTSFQEMLQPE